MLFVENAGSDHFHHKFDAGPENSTEFFDLLDDLVGDADDVTIQSSSSSLIAKKRRKYNHDNEFVLRIMPMQDIRRSYPTVFFNVFNSTDSIAMKNFFLNYYNPEGRFTRSCPAPTADNRAFQLSGIPLVCQYFHNFFHLMPDGVFELLNSQIYTSDSHWESRIVSEFTYKGTRIYDFPWCGVIPSRVGNQLFYESTSNTAIRSHCPQTRERRELAYETSTTSTEHNQQKQEPMNKQCPRKRKSYYKKKRFMDTSISMLTTLDDSQHVYDNTVTRNIDRSKLLNPTRTVQETGQLIMHIGKDKNIYSMELHFASRFECDNDMCSEDCNNCPYTDEEISW